MTLISSLLISISVEISFLVRSTLSKMGFRNQDQHYQILSDFKIIFRPLEVGTKAHEFDQPVLVNPTFAILSQKSSAR